MTEQVILEAPAVFTYLNYHIFISEWFEYKKVQNPRYSHRLFAKKSDVKSPSFLHLVMKEERNLSEEKALDVASAMGLDEDESRFFIWLVRLKNSKSVEAQQEAWENITATQRFIQARRLDAEAIKVLSNWRFSAILELASCEHFKADAQWISTQLNPKITIPQAQEALDCLSSLGLIEVGPSGNTIVTNKTLVTPHEAHGLGTHSYHRNMNTLAGEAITRFRAEDRHFGAVTVAVPDALIPILKQEIARFQERILNLCDGAEQAPTRVMQLNLQLFPLSSAIKGK